MTKWILTLLTLMSGMAQAQEILNVGALPLGIAQTNPVPGEIGVKSVACYSFLKARESSQIRLRFTTSTSPLRYKTYSAAAYCTVNSLDYLYPELIGIGDDRVDDVPSPDYREFKHSACNDSAVQLRVRVSVECKSPEFKALRRQHAGQPLRLTIKHTIGEVEYPECEWSAGASCE